jgi:lysophospholipase L1-like esterase
MSNVEVGRGSEWSEASLRPVDVEPYLRGVAWPAGAGAIYPRADPSDVGRLPADTWATATLPVGVRLELVGDASALEVEYHTSTDDLGYRGASAGTTFTVWRGGTLVDQQVAVLGDGRVRLDLGGGAADDRLIVYLSEGMKPSIIALTGVDGSISPASRQPRWLAYGDSIAEGWIASGPSGAWPAIAARTNGLDVINLGYAGSARGELVSAEHVASLDAAVISITHGTNCWTRIAHSAEQMAANTTAFLRVVRAGHPGVPIVVASPIVRPDGERTPNKLGATHADIRGAMERAAQKLIDAGDELITLISGAAIVDPSLLADGIHPGDEGHAVLARVFGDAVAAALG